MAMSLFKKPWCLIRSDGKNLQKQSVSHPFYGYWALSEDFRATVVLLCEIQSGVRVVQKSQLKPVKPWLKPTCLAHPHILRFPVEFPFSLAKSFRFSPLVLNKEPASSHRFDAT